MPQTYRWEIPGRTCVRGGLAPITLHLSATISGRRRILTGLTLAASGPGLTCGARFAPTWAERAIDKLGWIGRPLAEIVAGPEPMDHFTCACTEVSLGPKLWPHLRQLAEQPPRLSHADFG